MEVTVTATITDTDNSAWIGASWQARLVDFNGVKPVFTDGTLVETSRNGNLDDAGKLLTTLGNNAQINPTNTRWEMTITPLASTGSITRTLSITAAGDVSVQILPVPAPRFSLVTTPNATGYADAEITDSVKNSYYFNTTDNTFHVWNGQQFVQANAGALPADVALLNTPNTGNLNVTGNLVAGVDINLGGNISLTNTSAAIYFGNNTKLECDVANTITFTANVNVNGPFYCNGAKNFRIQHPLDTTKYLVHSSIEGPESAVFYRGESVTDQSAKCVVTLPDYFEALTHKENRTVQVTEIVDDENLMLGNIGTSRVVDGKFTVYSQFGLQKFCWEVKAVRADISILETETEKEK